MKNFDCPFCGKPSAISVDDQFFCFSCGMGGDRVTCLKAIKNISYQEAMRRLGRTSLPEQDRSELKNQVLAALSEAEKYYESALSLHKIAYFKKRGFKKETIEKFHLGYSAGGKNIYNHLLKKGFSKDVIEDAGLICYNKEGEVFDKFWKRVMFPIQDENGKTIGFGGRVLDDKKPKYLNSPESIVFDKSHNLYALNMAKESKEEYFLLAEGYIDIITLYQNGFTNAVASLGTSFTHGQAELLAKYKKSVYIVYDSDSPGQAAAKKAVSVLLKKGIDVKVVSITEPYKDVDDMLKAEGPEAFRRQIEKAISGTAFLAIDKKAEEIAAMIFSRY